MHKASFPTKRAKQTGEDRLEATSVARPVSVSTSEARPTSETKPIRKAKPTSMDTSEIRPMVRPASETKPISEARLKMLSEGLAMKPAKVPRKRPLQLTYTKNKKPRTDIFPDQEGGGKMIAPIRAAVEQAKALLRRKRKCKRRKGCKQVGARVSRRRKVYNPNRRRRNVYSPKRTTKKSKRKHG